MVVRYSYMAWATRTVDLSSARPPVLVFMILRIACLTTYLHMLDRLVNTIVGLTKLVRQDTILGGLSVGQFYLHNVEHWKYVQVFT